VLTNAAEKLYALNDGAQAAAVALQVLALQPAAPVEQRRVAWTVVAHTSFEKGALSTLSAPTEVGADAPKDAPRHVDRATRLGLQTGRSGARAGPAARAIEHYAGWRWPESPSAPLRNMTRPPDAGAEGLDGAAHAGGFPRRYPKHPLQTR
jgi:hypothetical protein